MRKPGKIFTFHFFEAEIDGGRDATIWFFEIADLVAITFRDGVGFAAISGAVVYDDDLEILIILGKGAIDGIAHEVGAIINWDNDGNEWIFHFLPRVTILTRVFFIPLSR